MFFNFHLAIILWILVIFERRQLSHHKSIFHSYLFDLLSETSDTESETRLNPYHPETEPNSEFIILYQFIKHNYGPIQTKQTQH